jgi:Zn-dependent protease
MNGSLNLILYQISILAIPAIIAITFHEASHGYVAHLLGDDTAWRLGRVSFNPLVHIDPFGTVVLPLMLLMLRSPFLFGYAKPVPVNFRTLRHPRLGMILVAAAGPGMNLLLATIAALGFHIAGYVPAPGAEWLAANLRNALLLNVILAIFNLLPIPPLDGGRVLMGVLPSSLARLLSRAEPYGMLMLIGLIFVLPLLSAQFGINLDPISKLLMTSTNAVLGIILRLTGNM